MARIGAAFYVLWGLLDYNAAYGVYQLRNLAPGQQPEPHPPTKLAKLLAVFVVDE